MRVVMRKSANGSFASCLREVFDDSQRQQQYNERLAKLLDGWSAIIDSIPDEWNYANFRKTTPINIDLTVFYNIVCRYQQKDFWKTT